LSVAVVCGRVFGVARCRRWEELRSRWWGFGEALFRCGLGVGGGEGAALGQSE
jgi:hypothetical protein